MSATPTTPTTAEPNQAEIGRFVDLVDALWKFEAIQRSVRGHGAFPPDTPMPDPSFVRVMAWLKELSCMSDHPTKQTTDPICPVCEEEIEDGDGTYEGDTLYHYVCCPADEMDDGNWQHGVIGDEWGVF